MGRAVIAAATLEIRHINNSVWVGNEKTRAMQWITPKQTPTLTHFPAQTEMS